MRISAECARGQIVQFKVEQRCATVAAAEAAGSPGQNGVAKWQDNKTHFIVCICARMNGNGPILKWLRCGLSSRLFVYAFHEASNVR